MPILSILSSFYSCLSLSSIAVPLLLSTLRQRTRKGSESGCIDTIIITSGNLPNHLEMLMLSHIYKLEISLRVYFLLVTYRFYNKILLIKRSDACNAVVLKDTLLYA